MRETCQTPRRTPRSSKETLISFNTVGKSRWLTESLGKFGLADCILFSFQHQYRAWRTFPPPGKPRVLPHPAPGWTPPGQRRGGRPGLAPDSTMELAPAHAHSRRAISLFLPRCCPPAPARRSPPAARDPEEVAVRAQRRTPGRPAPEDARCRGAEAVPPCLDFPPFPRRRDSSAHTHPFTTKKGSSMDMAPSPAARALPEVSRSQRLGRGDPEQRCAQTRVPVGRRSSTRSAPWAESHSKPAPAAASSPGTSGAWPRPHGRSRDQS